MLLTYSPYTPPHKGRSGVSFSGFGSGATGGAAETDEEWASWLWEGDAGEKAGPEAGET